MSTTTADLSILKCPNGWSTSAAAGSELGCTQRAPALVDTYQTCGITRDGSGGILDSHTFTAGAGTANSDQVALWFLCGLSMG